MQNAKVQMPFNQVRRVQPASVAILLVILVLVGWKLLTDAQSRVVQPSGTLISQAILEEQYGLKVNLIAVTGAGGFVDVRIRIVDGEKAKLLLSDTTKFPALWVKDEVTLNAPADTKSQKILFDDGGTMFIIYPNSGNAVRQGTPVSILFGDILLEPINAQ